MYTEDKIFGPFTLKQSLCVAAGMGIFYFFESYIPEQYRVMTIAGIVIVTIVGIFRFQPKRIANIDEYFSIKKAELEPSAYHRMLQVKHAEVLSQIHMRKEKGLSDDIDLLSMAAVLAKLIEESKN